MRQMGRFVLAALASLAATGCITSSTLLKVKADGSGTIEQTLTMKKEAADELKELMAGFGSSADAKAAPAELFSEKDMRAAAAKLGEGVTFVSSKAIASDERVGRVAIYKFTDVTRLRVDQRPAAPGPSSGPVKQSGAPEEITFGFTKLPNGHSQLSILFPSSGAEPKKDTSTRKQGGPSKADAGNAAQVEMMKKVLDGLKIDMVVEVAGPIVKTNSPYVEGRRVTLLEMDFAQLLDNQEQLRAMAEPRSVEEAKQALKNIKGFKVNLDKELVVEFGK